METQSIFQEIFKYNQVGHSRLITKRFVLYVGFKCNLRCQFCYYLKSIEDGTAKNETIETLKKKILLAYKLGKREIDFTGGEATIHPDFEELLAYCKSLGFTTINVITNGLRISNFETLKKFRDAGLNEVLFSIHSRDEVLHDELTQVKGSFKKIIQAVENAKALGIRVRINSVINPQNYHDVSNLLEFFKTLQPSSVNLIIFNPSEETIGYSGHEKVRLNSYEPIGVSLGQALDRYKKDFPVINVRFLPFCYLKGHEDSIRTYWQEIYEKEEWDPVLHWAFRKNWLFVGAGIIFGGLISLLNTNVFLGRKSCWTFISELFQHARISYLFKRHKDCSSCSLKNICGGVPKDFARNNPQFNVYPYKGKEKILNPVAFGFKYPIKFPSNHGGG